MEELEAPPSILRRVERNMELDQMDTGFTYSNLFLRESVVVIGRSSSGAEFLNSFVHELRHLADDIAYVYGYPLRGEEVAYLTGDIALALSDIVCAMSCDSCRTGRRYTSLSARTPLLLGRTTRLLPISCMR